MNETVQEFPSILVEFAKEQLKTKRESIEYTARFGNSLYKGGARLILAAAGETCKG